MIFFEVLFLYLFLFFSVRTGEVRSFKGKEFPKANETIDFNEDKMKLLKSLGGVDLAQLHHSVSNVIQFFPTPPKDQIVMIEFCVQLKEGTLACVTNYEAIFGEMNDFFHCDSVSSTC